MSAQGVTLRLKRVSQLRRLCLSLGKARVSEQRRGNSMVLTGEIKGKEEIPEKDKDV